MKRLVNDWPPSVLHKTRKKWDISLYWDNTEHIAIKGNVCVCADK